MGSLSKQYSQDKLLGKVYTPAFVVDKILDDIHYNSSAILGKTVLDPACGDGQFLAEVVRRIIKFSTPEELARNLHCVHGWDIDAKAVEECIENLDLQVKDLDVRMKWNIEHVDSIRKYAGEPDLFFPDAGDEKYDYIIGNPPYIRIQHLEKEQREYIQRNYRLCKSGSTDIYIAFYELCMSLLSPEGICGLITPNTFLFTETAAEMRQHFSEIRSVHQITNYGDIQLFDNISTYSAIVIFDRKAHGKIRIQVATDRQKFVETEIEAAGLSGKPWKLSQDAAPLSNGRKLGDICKIHVGVTTLCDKAYVFQVIDNGGSTVIAKTKYRGEVPIERGILKPIVKGSKLKNSTQPVSEYILFPYIKKNGRHAIMPEDEMKTNYLLAWGYLESVRELLDKRDNGKPNPVAWYAFGRTQGLDSTWGPKIIFSPMSEKPNFVWYPNPDCTFYSGYCIKYDGDIPKLLSQLNSERMEKFIAVSSRDFRGGWKAYNKRVVENFEVEI